MADEQNVEQVEQPCPDCNDAPNTGVEQAAELPPAEAAGGE